MNLFNLFSSWFKRTSPLPPESKLEESFLKDNNVLFCGSIPENSDAYCVDNIVFLIQDYIDSNREQLNQSPQYVEKLRNILTSREIVHISKHCFDTTIMKCNMTHNYYIEEIESCYFPHLSDTDFKRVVDFHLSLIQFIFDPEQLYKNQHIYRSLICQKKKDQTVSGKGYTVLDIFDDYLDDALNLLEYKVYNEQQTLVSAIENGEPSKRMRL